MNPDLNRAAKEGEFTLYKFKVDLEDIDPLPILEALPNVLMISYDSSYEPMSIPNPMFASDNLDSFTLVNKKDGKLQYIIVYNQSLSRERLRLALARELGHVILQHDGTNPEFVWNEEASCFAHHFLCPLCALEEKRRKEQGKTICFRPKRERYSLELKEMQRFPDLDSMREHVAYEQTRWKRFVGDMECFYHPDDIEVITADEIDSIIGWKNNCNVVVDGRTVGYCGIE